MNDSKRATLNVDKIPKSTKQNGVNYNGLPY